MKNRWIKLTCAGLALLMLSLTVIACPGPDTSSTSEMPVVNLKRVADNQLDLPGDTVTNVVTPEDGAIVVNGDLRLSVPPGAVSKQATVTITKYTQTPASMTSTKANAKEVVIMSDLYDLGPDNAQFNQPVQVTIPYDESLIPAGSSESQIGPIFFNGQNWVPLEREVDTENNLVSFQTKSFPGAAVVLGVALGAATWPAYIVVGAAIAVSWYYAGPKVVSQVKQDPVFWGNAAKYITPNDPTVQKYAGFMKIGFIGDSKSIDLKDLLSNPDAIKRFTTNVASNDSYIRCVDGLNSIPFQYRATEFGEDWKMPADFFKSNLDGDCKNVANAMASIFRYYGFDVKCVDGYQDGGRHGWAELIIDGKPYYVGAHAEIMPLDKAIKEYKLTRSKTANGASSMWDESGQKPYKARWWLSKLNVTVDKSKAYPGGQVVIDVFGVTGLSLDISLTLTNPDDSETQYSGTTDKETGVYRLTLPLKTNVPLGLYVVTAHSTYEEKAIVGVDIYRVEIPVLSADMLTSQFAPGDVVIINVTIDPPLETTIEVAGVDGRWMTDKDGYAFPTFPLSKDAKAGNYAFTVNAPVIGISAKVPFTVTLPPSLKVEIMPKEVKPGDIFIANVIVQPPVVTKITVRGYDGRWMTDKDGFAFPSLPVSKVAAPGEYQLVVEAPDLGLMGTATYTVTLTPTPQVNTINVVAAELDITVEGSNDTGDYEAQLFIGGEYVRGTLNGNEVHTTGRVSTNEGDADMHYDFVLSKDLSQVVSGSVSLIVDDGESYYFELRSLPRNTAYEASIKQEQGLDVMAYSISGTAVSSHYSSLSIQSSALGSVTSSAAKADSELIVVLVAATKDQLNAIFSE